MNEQITLEEAILTVQNQCSHSFNIQSECEYCGIRMELSDIDESDYDELCMNGEPVGTFK